MDIEGAEIEAYRGMEETLRDNNVRLAISAYHKVGGKPTYEVIAPWLKGIGFQVHVEDGMVHARKQHVH